MAAGNAALIVTLEGTPCHTRSLQGRWTELADATREGAAAATSVQHGRQQDGGSGVSPLTAAAYHATALSRLQQWPLVAEQLREVDPGR